MKKFFVFIAAAVLSASSVYAGGKIGVRDEYADEDSPGYPREQGRPGEYIVYSDNYVYDVDKLDYVDTSTEGNWIEDSAGNDLIWVNGHILPFSDIYRYDTYDGKESGIITENMQKVNLKVYADTKYTCIHFKENNNRKFTNEFNIVAAMDCDNNRSFNPTDTRYTTYFDLNGTRIDDVYKYIADRDRNPEEGTYFNYHLGMDCQFAKLIINVGSKDTTPGIYTSKAAPMPRLAVGQKGHYLVGNEALTNKKGILIEAEDGTDLYDDADIVLINEEDEIYFFNHEFGKDTYQRGIMDSNFKYFGAGGYSTYYFIRFGDLKVYALSTDDPSNTKSTKYFDADGNKIDDIYKYLETHGKDPSSGRFEIRNRKDVIVGEGIFGQEFDPELLSKNEIPEQSSQTVGSQNNNTPYTYGTAHFVGATQIINAKTFLISALLDTIKNK